MSNPYEEAREKIAKTLASMDNFRYEDLKEKATSFNEGSPTQSYYLRRADEILSLEGDGWQIALVKNDMSGVGKPNFKHVIWRAGE